MAKKKTARAPLTIAVPLTFSRQRLEDLLCTAFEGGVSRHWCRIVRYRRPRSRAEYGASPSYIDFPLSGGAVVCRDTYADGETDSRFTSKVLDREAIERGLRLMAETHPHHFADLVAQSEDAATGDVFLQLALLGEVRYG